METTPPSLKVVIAHEAQAVAVRAREMSERLAAELNSSCDVWSMESLLHQPLRQLAAAAASEADIVVIAARSRETLPSHLRDWIEDWLPRKKHGPTALVALFDEESEPPRESPSPDTYLGLIAKQGGMDFFPTPGGRRLGEFSKHQEVQPSAWETRTRGSTASGCHQRCDG